MGPRRGKWDGVKHSAALLGKSTSDGKSTAGTTKKLLRVAISFYKLSNEEIEKILLAPLNFSFYFIFQMATTCRARGL